MDSDYCIAVQEAANRLHVQKSLLTTLLKDK
jgi:ornithine carbamoyltransferase